MATVLTNDLLQEISVRCASRFITKQASLSEAIADESKNLELNPEQIKRVIETTNTIAYLRQLQGSEDRTSEFPVAEYKQVLSNMALPTLEDASNIKSASEDSNFSELAKNDRTSEISMQEKMAMLSKEMFKCKQVLEKMAYDKQYVLNSILALGTELSKVDNGIEKLAYVSDEIDYDKLVNLCGFDKQASLKTGLVFTDTDLDKVTKLCGLYKEAKELLIEEKNLIESLNKAASILEGAGYNVGAGLGFLGGKAVNGVGSMATGIAKAPFRKVKTGLGKAMGFAGKMGLSGLGLTHNNSVWGSLN